MLQPLACTDKGAPRWVACTSLKVAQNATQEGPLKTDTYLLPKCQD